MRLAVLKSALATCVAIVVQTAPAMASDIGPSTSVAAIRHDLPLLLATPLKNLRGTPSVDWVVANDQEAVAMWHAGRNRGLIILRFDSGHWLWRGSSVSTTYMPDSWTPVRSPGDNFDTAPCGEHLPGPPSAQKLLALGLTTAALADQLQTRLKPVSMPKTLTYISCDFASNVLWNTSGPYGITFLHKEEYDATWLTLIGRAPVDSESKVTLGSDLYCAFDLTTLPDDSPRNIEHLVHSVYQSLFPTPPPTFTFRRGSTIDVWFPYVLPESDQYVLSVSNVVPQLHDIPATLRDNVLHFVLPGFMLRRGAVAHGEIDGKSMEPSRSPNSPPEISRR
jgi:hypothetical protein